MISSLLKIEKHGKNLLRFGMAFYLVINAYNLHFEQIPNLLWASIIALSIIICAGLLLIHYKYPKAGIIGGTGALLYLIFKTINQLTLSVKVASTSWDNVLLSLLPLVLMGFALVILLGESIKELVRERITQPFPKR